MARTLLLVRHGKAERGRAELPDEERSLVPGAAEALEANYPTTFSLLKKLPAEPAITVAEAPVQLWVSPALRARQTADCVAEALEACDIPIGPAQAHASLLYQNREAFYQELSATPADSTVIAVGHIPFMEDVLERLTGCAVAFKPGSVAAVSLSGDPGSHASEGRLLWFVSGPKVG